MYKHLTKRQFIKRGVSASLTLAASGSLLANSSLVAKDAKHEPRKFILIILRGGMDGLAAVPAYGDKHYFDSRGALALAEPRSGTRQSESEVIDLDGYFGLHSRMKQLGGMYRAGEMAVIHATAPPYAKRSHFDAQNVLESGISTPHAAKTGWLNRSLAGLGTKTDDLQVKKSSVAISIAPSLPLVLQGEYPVTSWSPNTLSEPDEDTLSRLQSLYAGDPVLGPQLAAALDADEIVDNIRIRNSPGVGSIHYLANATAGFLRHKHGPQIAVLESNGWDTHNQQGSTGGTLANKLGELDTALGALKQAMGSSWQSTVALVVTEFGRTVQINGTRGTDHGVASAAFLLGGAVSGGKVVTDWPGLKLSRLYEGRDLLPTNDQRSIFKTVLVDHLEIDEGFVEEEVFPGSLGSQKLDGLII